MGDPGTLPPIVRTGPIGHVNWPPVTPGIPAAALAPTPYDPRRPPTTPALVDARHVEALDANTITLLVNAWTPVRIDRPKVFWPLDICEGLVYFAPNRIPPSFGPAYDGTTFPMAEIGRNGGICLLHAPGVWWLKFTTSFTQTQLSGLLLDAEDPAVAARYLSEPGANNWKQTLTTLTSTTKTTIVNANRFRSAITIQCVLGGPVRVTCAIQGASVAGATAGWYITLGGSVTFQNDTLVRSRFDAGLDPVLVTNPSNIWITEYSNNI